MFSDRALRIANGMQSQGGSCIPSKQKPKLSNLTLTNYYILRNN